MIVAILITRHQVPSNILRVSNGAEIQVYRYSRGGLGRRVGTNSTSRGSSASDEGETFSVNSQ